MDSLVLPSQVDGKDEQKQKSESSISEDEIVNYENITVKFRISESSVIAQTYPSCLKVGEVKIDIGRKFEIDPKFLCIKQRNKAFQDDNPLLIAKPNEFGVYELSLETVLPADQTIDQSTHAVPPKLDLRIYYSKFRLADFITVRITGEGIASCCNRDIVVEIQNQAIVKPYLGGYRNRETGIEYFDAYTQSGPYVDKNRQLFSREVQTAELVAASADTTNEKSTQAFGQAGELIFVSSVTDYTIIPQKYMSDQQRKCIEMKKKKIILLQRNIRRYLLYKNIKRAAAEYRRLVANRAEYDQKFEEKQRNRLKLSNLVKTFPRTKDDFDILYGQVHRWKQAELKRITKLYTGATRIAEVSILLDKEIQLLVGIEKQRQIVRDAIKDCREDKLLQKMGEPIKWVGYKDRVVEMDLIRTQRVRFLRGIYNDLKKRKSKNERLKILDSMKKILVHEKDCQQTQELLDLFQREQNLLLMTNSYDMDILHKRQLVLFLEIIKYTKDNLPKDIQTKMCDVCKVVKPVDKFSLHTRQNSVNTCKNCFRLKAPSLDNSAYKAILRSIQRDERKKNSLASYAFILQEDDIRFIIDIIWHGHSAISKSSDVLDLRLPRWIVSEEWSPWNCVCLTEAEARNHINIKSLDRVYDDKIRGDIAGCHLLAKSAFKKLIATDMEFVETGTWWNVGIREKIV